MKKMQIVFLMLSVVILFSGLCLSQNGIVADQQIKNLRAFAKLYGYVRFFHPSDEVSKIDWDKFAIYGADKVKLAVSDAQLKETLKQLFLPIAPTAQIYSSGETVKDIPELFPKDANGLKVVAWQHQGVGLAEESYTYYSIRTNKNYALKRPATNSTQNFAAFNQFIDATIYRGKEIKLCASVKANVSGSGNSGHLWLRVDRENKQPGFFYNMNDRPIAYDNWKEYEFSGVVDEDAKMIFFGGFLRGDGKIWFDNFKLFFRDKERSWQEIQISNPGFEDKDQISNPKSWNYGLAGFNYIFDNHEKSTGNTSFSIEKIPGKPQTISKLFDRSPKIGESINEEISPGLFCKIPLALYSKNNATPGTNSNLVDSLLAALDVIKLPLYSANIEKYRLGNVINAWNVLQHFYPYFDVVKVDWNDVLTETLTETFQDNTSDEFYITLLKLTALRKSASQATNFTNCH